MADNITHGLAAALLAQAGLRQRYGALATVALLVGSELPDFDALFELGGPVSGFVHHRGITHSLLGGAGLALLGAALLWSVWRSHPYWRVTWLVYLGVLLHIGMDYLTSYGTQIFLPFSTGHYTADAVYIVDFTYSALMITGLLLVRMVRRQRQERYGRASLVWVGLGGIAWFAAPALAERPLTLLALQSAGLHVIAFALVVGLVAWVCRHWKEHRAVVLGQVGVGAGAGVCCPVCGDPCCSAAPDGARFRTTDGACAAPGGPASAWGRAVAMARYRCDGHDLSRQPCLYFPRDCDSPPEHCERSRLR